MKNIHFRKAKLIDMKTACSGKFKIWKPKLILKRQKTKFKRQRAKNR